MNYPYMYKFARSAYTVSSPNLLLRKQMAAVEAAHQKAELAKDDEDKPPKQDIKVDTPPIKDTRDHKPTEEDLEKEKSLEQKAKEALADIAKQELKSMIKGACAYSIRQVLR